MGLKEIVGIRQYTGFTPAGKAVKMYEVRFTTEKTVGEFTFDIAKDDYDADAVAKMARTRAAQIDTVIG